MRRSLTVRNLTAALSGVVLIGLALTGAATAITSANFRYPRPKTGYLTIPPPAFVTEVPSIAYTRNAGFLEVTGSGCFDAPVNLPQGAKVTQLAMWHTKNDAAQSYLILSRALPADATMSQIERLDAADTDGAIKMIAKVIRDPSLQLVNNAHFTYSLLLCLSDAQFFLGARIRYNYTSAGD